MLKGTLLACPQRRPQPYPATSNNPITIKHCSKLSLEHMVYVVAGDWSSLNTSHALTVVP